MFHKKIGNFSADVIRTLVSNKSNTACSREDKTSNEGKRKSKSSMVKVYISFSNRPLKKRPGMTIEEFGLHSDDHFEPHLLGNEEYWQDMPFHNASFFAKIYRVSHCGC